MVKTDTKIEIKCPCKTTTITKFKPANAYVEHTEFVCGCGRVYIIRDYRNGITTYSEKIISPANSFCGYNEQKGIKNGR